MKELLSEEARQKNKNTVYDLIANIVHDGDPSKNNSIIFLLLNKKEVFKLINLKKIIDKGTYRVHVLHKGTGNWYEMQDLHVTDILPQMITLSEAYIQIWEQVQQPSS